MRAAEESPRRRAGTRSTQVEALGSASGLVKNDEKVREKQSECDADGPLAAKPTKVAQGSRIGETLAGPAERRSPERQGLGVEDVAVRQTENDAAQKQKFEKSGEGRKERLGFQPTAR
ncbi:MAG: hypothetical protein K2X38_16355 [Gemmataceae bacterium]|nr:hypothetical protein [Gemmataceae bacterium]